MNPITINTIQISFHSGVAEERLVTSDADDDGWLVTSWFVIGALLALAAASEEVAKARLALMTEGVNGIGSGVQSSRHGWVAATRFYVASLVALVALKTAGVKVGVKQKLAHYR